MSVLMSNDIESSQRHVLFEGRLVAFVTKGLPTERQMWRGKDAFHQIYSGDRQDITSHHETSHPDKQRTRCYCSTLTVYRRQLGEGGVYNMAPSYTLNTHKHTERVIQLSRNEEVRGVAAFGLRLGPGLRVLVPVSASRLKKHCPCAFVWSWFT